MKGAVAWFARNTVAANALTQGKSQGQNRRQEQHVEHLGAVGLVPRSGDALGDGAPLGLVAVEQGIGAMALGHQCKLPGEVEGILNAAVHAVALDGAAGVGGIPRQQQAA